MPMAPKLLFAKFIFNPDASSKLLNNDLIVFTFFKVVSPRKMVSSAYWRMLTGSLFVPTRKLLNT